MKMIIVTASFALFTSTAFAEDAKPAAKVVDVKAAKELKRSAARPRVLGQVVARDRGHRA